MNLVANLDRSRWEPLAAVAQDGPLVGCLIHDGVPVDVLQLAPVLSRLSQGSLTTAAVVSPRRLIAGLIYSVRLARYLRSTHVNLVHANSLKLCLLGGLAARLAGIPVVWQVHAVVAEPLMPRVAVQLFRLLARWIPSFVICNSQATLNGLKLVNDKTAVIPCGIETARFRPNGHRDGSQRIGMISRFAPIKGQHVFLQAAQRVGEQNRSARFVLAGTALFGEDDYEAEIREEAGKGALAGRVEMLGFVTDVSALIQTLDVVVQPSTAPEGFGQIVVEAMMCAKPVVASAAGGSADLIQDRVTGRLVPPGDPIALADAIGDVLAHPAQAAEMGRRAREIALERYDVRKTTRAIEEVYSRVLARL